MITGRRNCLANRGLDPQAEASQRLPSENYIGILSLFRPQMALRAANALQLLARRRGGLLQQLQPLGLLQTAARGLQTSAPVRQLPGMDGMPGEGETDEDDEVDVEGGEDGGGGDGKQERLGRPFLDPRAPRRQEVIRTDPKNAKWGVMIDILEHAAYCDGQREEDPDGFFFDLSTPDYDSDCDGDPFSNGYLTEDEMEWPEEYAPAPPVPGRVMDQVYFLYTAHKVPIPRLAVKYGMSTERVSALINLKRSEPEMIASDRYNPKADELLQQLYRGKSGGTSARGDNWAPHFDVGVSFNVMPDDQVPDEAYPVRRLAGTKLRVGHTLPRLPWPPAGDRKERKHKAKFVFTDVSGGRTNSKQYGRAMLVSDWSGAIRPASNVEALYRSNETRYWSLEAGKGRSGLPFADEDAHKPASFKIPP